MCSIRKETGNESFGLMSNVKVFWEALVLSWQSIPRFNFLISPFHFGTSIYYYLGLHNTFICILRFKITAELCNYLARIQALHFVIVQKGTVLGIKRSLSSIVA